MDGGHVMDDEIPATPSVDEAIRALREYAQFEPQTRVMVWTPALATVAADALEAAARPAAGSSSPDVTALAERAKALAAKLTPHVCASCNGNGWTEDQNWSPEDWQLRSGKWERIEGEGLIPCGACSLGDWSTYRDERTEPTTVLDGLTWGEQIEAGQVLEAQAARITELETALRPFLRLMEPDGGWRVLDDDVLEIDDSTALAPGEADAIRAQLDTPHQESL